MARRSTSQRDELDPLSVHQHFRAASGGNLAPEDYQLAELSRYKAELSEKRELVQRFVARGRYRRLPWCWVRPVASSLSGKAVVESAVPNKPTTSPSPRCPDRYSPMAVKIEATLRPR